MKKHRVNYIKNCVEVAIRRQLSNDEFNKAYEKTIDEKCKSMQDRINQIIKNL